jgi:hypothetical protein
VHYVNEPNTFDLVVNATTDITCLNDTNGTATITQTGLIDYNDYNQTEMMQAHYVLTRSVRYLYQVELLPMLDLPATTGQQQESTL